MILRSAYILACVALASTASAADLKGADGEDTSPRRVRGHTQITVPQNLTAQKLYALWDYDGGEKSHKVSEDDVSTPQAPTAPLLPPSGFVSGFAAHLNAEEAQCKAGEL